MMFHCWQFINTVLRRVEYTFDYWPVSGICNKFKYLSHMTFTPALL
jgi:hypothetical protein